MGTAYFIVLDKPAPDLPVVNGQFLAREANRLTRIARSLKLRSLDEYVSYSPDEARGMMEDMGGDPEGVQFPDEQWFDPDEGLAWVTALVRHLRSDANAVKNVDGILSDLHEFEAVFSQAKAVGARWHLQVDF